MFQTLVSSTLACCASFRLAIVVLVFGENCSTLTKKGITLVYWINLTGLPLPLKEQLAKRQILGQQWIHLINSLARGSGPSSFLHPPPPPPLGSKRNTNAPSAHQTWLKWESFPNESYKFEWTFQYSTVQQHLHYLSRPCLIRKGILLFSVFVTLMLPKFLSWSRRVRGVKLGLLYSVYSKQPLIALTPRILSLAHLSIAYIQGRYWSVQIDDISLRTPEFSNPNHALHNYTFRNMTHIGCTFL